MITVKQERLLIMLAIIMTTRKVRYVRRSITTARLIIIITIYHRM